MNILFDHQTFSLQPYGGISRYFRELIDGINTEPDYHAKLSVMYSDNIYARRPAPFPNFKFRGRGTLLYKANQLYSQRCIKRNDFDIFHATYYDPYFINWLPNRPFVITIHDMTHERLGHRFQDLVIDKFTAGKHQLAHQAQAIIAVSEHAKQDIIDLLKVNPEKVHVVYHATSMKAPREPLKGHSDPYILFVGTRGHYKNFIGLLKAISQLPTYLDLRLICAGGGSFTTEEFREIQKLGLSSRVKQYSFESDSELAQLYYSATAFVFPSLYEGFGIPILEAFTCNCPCLVSNNSSLSEVAGEAAILFDPEQPDSIAQAIELVTDNLTIRASLIQKGQNRVNQFSWSDSVKRTLDVYKKI